MRLPRRSDRVPGKRLIRPAFLAALCTVAIAAEPLASNDPIVASVHEAEQVRRESALVEARAALAAVDEMVAEGRVEEAADRLLAARARLLLMSGPDVEPLAVRLAEARRRCLDLSLAADQTRAGAERTQAMARVRAARDDQLRVSRDVFAERQARIRGLMAQGHLELALATARRLVADYPFEADAERLFNEVLVKAHDQRRLSIVERNKELRQEISDRIERSLIPTCYDGMPLYPADWLDRVATRAQESAQSVALPEWEERIQARLVERLAVVAYDQRLPSDIFQDIGQRTGLNLLIDPAVFANDKPIPSLRAHNITIGSLLTWVCQSAQVRWTISRGGIYIGGEVDPEPVNAFYDLSEVMFGGVDQPGRLLGLAPNIPGGAAGGGVGGGAATLFAAPAEAPKAGLTADAVMELIKKAISPSTWSRPGCGMTLHGSSLIVAAPARVHRLIRQFISSRSSLQTMMVNLDMRWVEIDDGFLEEIGVDWSAGDLAKNPIGAANTPHYDGLYHSGENHVNNGSVTNVLPASMASFSSPSTAAGTGLKLSGALLKTLQLNAVASAVERNTRGSLLSSPSITTINGVRSSCFFGQQTAYIAGYDVRAGGGNSGGGAVYDPRIGNILSGAVLDVKPLVSADGKYVTLDIKPQLSDMVMYVDSFTSIQVLGDGGEDPETDNNTAGTVIIGSMPIELPMVRMRSGATTVHIPHGGTLLMGGFGRHLDQTASSKVPFLGHIPFLGRLFGMRGRYSDRRQLYLLITANIHNYQELEATK